MPRNKRWLYDSGLHVPLLIQIPEKWRELATDDFQAGGTSDRLVSFVDFGPTVLSLCGVQPPEHMQGRAFLGKFAAEPRNYVYGLRGRMDERIDLLRSVSDGRYVYIRNYMPHRIYGQHLWYMFETPTTRVWQTKFLAGELTEEQSHFWEKKPSEELYDLQSDRDEVHNLAGEAQHASQLDELRRALRTWELEVRDVGFLPEAEMHARAGKGSPYDYGHTDGWDLQRLLESVDIATFGHMRPNEAALRSLQTLDASDAAARYWGAVTFLGQGPAALEIGREDLRAALQDESPSVRIIAAETLGRFGDDEDLAASLPVLLDLADIERHGVYVAVAALNALDELDERAESVKDEIAALPRKADGVPQRMGDYADRLISKTLLDLE
jgi:uncharacterized sulfatase